jgi:hypothetical protein
MSALRYVGQQLSIRNFTELLSGVEPLVERLRYRLPRDVAYELLPSHALMHLQNERERQKRFDRAAIHKLGDHSVGLVAEIALLIHAYYFSSFSIA